MEKEYEHLKIKLTDKSLGSLIKNQKEFMKESQFSRTEYEKFLIVNNVTAVIFEKNLAIDFKFTFFDVPILYMPSEFFK